MRRGTVLEQINALPRSERHSSRKHRNRQLSLCQGSANVRRHVVGTFDGVAIPRIVFPHETLEKIGQIADYVRIGVLLNRQRGRCVLDKHRQQAGFDTCG
jgi:hypothetical protein